MSREAIILVTFTLGVLIGYLWRDYVSRARRARYWADRERRDKLFGRRSNI